MSDILQQSGTLPISGQQFPYYGTIQQPLFLASDVAEALEYNKSKVDGTVDTRKMVQIVPNEEKLLGTISRADQLREMWLLREFGLYEVLFRSRKPLAVRFKNSVKAALVSLRLQREEILKEELKKLFEDNHRIDSENQLLHQNNVILENRYVALNHTYMDTIPMQNYYYATRQQDCQLDIGQLATLLSIPGFGRNNLFRYLREHHILMNNNRPYQRYNGEFSVVLVTDESGRRHPKTIVNQDGINRVIRLLSNDGHQLGDIVIPTEEVLEERLESIDFTAAQSAT